MFDRKRRPRFPWIIGGEFSERLIGVLHRSREEAVRLQHDYVGTEHILLALLKEENGQAARILARLNVAVPRVEKRLEESVIRGKATLARGELPYTSRAKKVLEFTMDAARRTRSPIADTEHLLFGLLREEKGIAAEVLSRFEVDLERATWAQDSLVAAGDSVEGVSDGFTVRIDDDSQRSIHEQIVSQVTEAIATGALQPGDRLPTVRKLADAADIAPGTVARAYGELERRGMVVTEGTRGTRVAERAATPSSDPARREMLVGLLRPVAVAAFHLGADADEVVAALKLAMRGIFTESTAPPSGPGEVPPEGDGEAGRGPSAEG